jgi:large subunit ribosomal protein L17
MYRNMVTSLLDHERIETTDAKAKGVRRLAEKMITLGKRGDLHARRRALRVIRNRVVAAKVFDDLAERFRDRPGGYTRVVKVRNRAGDAAAMSIVELIGYDAGAKRAARKTTPDAKTTQESAGTKKAAARKKPAPKQAAATAEPKKKTSKKKASSKKTEAKPASKPKATKKAPAKKKTTKKK